MIKTFKCKISGNTVSFYNELDISSMRKDENYTEVIEDEKEPEKIKSTVDYSNESKNDGASLKEDGKNGRVERKEKNEVLVAKKRGRKPHKL